MSKEVIASGTVTNANGITIIGTVYNEFTAGTESVKAGDKYVTLTYKKENAEDPLTSVIDFDTIETAAGGTLTVPGFNGHADVVVTDPTEVMYSKTKAIKTGTDTKTRTVNLTSASGAYDSETEKTTVTITPAAAVTGLYVGGTVTISGMTTAALNGNHVVTDITGSDFSFVVAEEQTVFTMTSGKVVFIDPVDKVQINVAMRFKY